MKGIKLWLGVIQLLVLLTLLTVAIKQERTHFQADLLSVLPAVEQSVLVENAETWFFDQYKTRVMVTLSGDNAIEAHDQLHTLLSEKQWLDTSLQSLDVSEITQFYTQYQGALLTKSYQALLEQPEQLVPFATEKLTATADPFVGASFNQDPSLSVADFAEQQFDQHSAVSVKEGRLVINGDADMNSHENLHYLLVLTLPETAAGLVNSQLTSNELLSFFNRVKQSYPNVDIVHSGIIFHTAENAAQAEFEMSFFGGVSMLGMLVLIIVVFRSIFPIIGALLTIANAVLAGFVALVWLFPTVHMLSFVFGITLIGIAIDYSFHIMVEYFQTTETTATNNTSKKQPDQQVVKSILLGFVTTAVGYLVFAFAPLNLMPQIATFVIAGLAGAVAFSLLILPHIMVRGVTAKGKVQFVENVIRLFKHIQHHQRKITLLLGLLLVIAYAIVPLKFDDNIRLLNASSEQMLANEKNHQQLLQNTNVYRFYVVATSFQALLEKEEQISADINQQLPNAQVNTLSDWVPSKQKQQLSFGILSAAQQSGVFDQLSTMFDYPISFDQLNYLEEAELTHSPLSTIVTSKLYRGNSTLANEQGYVSLMEVKQLTQAQLAELLPRLTEKYPQHLVYVDKAGTLTQVLTEFRLQLYWGFVLFFIVILLVFSLRFTVKDALKSGAILILVIALSLYASMLVQQTLNIFNVFAIMLILALAIDYLIFYRERGLLKPNVLAITLSAISSILVFGMLSFSQTPAVFSFGITVMFGISFIYLFAPIIAPYKGKE